MTHFALLLSSFILGPLIDVYGLLIPDEEIDGESYFGLTGTIMITQLPLKAGQMIKIKKHLESFNDHVSVLYYLKLHDFVYFYLYILYNIVAVDLLFA